MAFAQASSFRSTIKADTTHPKSLILQYDAPSALWLDLWMQPVLYFPSIVRLLSPWQPPWSGSFLPLKDLFKLNLLTLGVYSQTLFVRTETDIPRQNGGYLEFSSELSSSQSYICHKLVLPAWTCASSQISCISLRRQFIQRAMVPSHPKLLEYTILLLVAKDTSYLTWRALEKTQLKATDFLVP